jgi:hypothetical protein
MAKNEENTNRTELYSEFIRSDLYISVSLWKLQALKFVHEVDIYLQFTYFSALTMGHKLVPDPQSFNKCPDLPIRMRFQVFWG